MDIPWSDPRARRFASSVGLITSDGPNGPDIMAAEWTHQVSYRPALIAICIKETTATAENIRATKEFGISLASSTETSVASISGGHSGRDIDKVAALTELGYQFYPGKVIAAKLVAGAALNLECRLVEESRPGDHTILIGEVVADEMTPDASPLVYHDHAYWRLSERMSRPGESEMAHITDVLQRHEKTRA